MQGSTNLATSHPTLENILKTGNLANANEIAKSMSSISDYGKNKQESQIMRQRSFSNMAARELYLEMR